MANLLLFQEKFHTDNLFSTSSQLKFNKSEDFRATRANSKDSNTVKQQPLCFKSITTGFHEAAIFI